MKNGRWKKTLAVILVSSMLIVGIPTTVFAEEGLTFENLGEFSIVNPRLTYIVAAETDVVKNGNVATVDCWVKGDYYDATKAKVIAELQVKNSATNWIPVAIWTDTQNDFMATVYETKTINPDNTYRVKATYTVWEGTQSETITVFSDEV